MVAEVPKKDTPMPPMLRWRNGWNGRNGFLSSYSIEVIKKRALCARFFNAFSRFATGKFGDLIAFKNC